MLQGFPKSRYGNRRIQPRTQSFTHRLKSETRSKIHSAAYGKAKMQKLPANIAAASLNVTLPNSRQQQALKKISAASLLVMNCEMPSAKMPSHSISVSRAIRDRPVFHCRTSQGEALIYFSALIPQETVKNLFFAESSRI